MARFSFVKARKKESPQPNFAKPMSKAHKILGSTPISIDSLQPWDDVSSGFSGRISNTTPSYAYSEDDSSDYHVAIASSDYDSSNDSEIRLAALESSSLGSGSEDSMGDATHGPRKTQSTSTIRSWYDTSKESSPTSQQPQATSTVRGVPPKIHKMLDLESSPTAPKPKKKPPMLDFSNLRGSSRLSRKAPNGPTQSDSTIAKEFESPTVESPLSLAAPIGKPRKTHKRSTKDGAPSSDLKETHHSTTVERRHRTGSTKEAPSLYDHYEQMTIRQLMHEDQKLKEEQQNDHGTKQQGTNTDDNEEPWTAQDSPWLQDTLPPTPQTAFMIGLTPAASHKRTNSAGSKMIANTKQSTTLGTSDLQATSMLMLSSDSEDDNEPTSLLPRWTTSLNNHSPSASGPLSLPPRVSSRASDHRPMRHSNKPSFASVNTYSTFLSNSRLSTATAIDANFESSMPYTSDFLSRTSSISDASRASALQPSANYVHEARAVNMLVGRRPMTVDNGEKNSPEELSSSSSLSPAARKALNLSQTPPEELTPPLSPTSVDFFLRSARSSVDGSGSQSRYMAVTRKEQMLLSALRNNKQYGKEQPFNTLHQCDQNSSTETLTTASTSEEVEEDEEDEGDEEEGESNSVLGTDIVAGKAVFHFGFPAPPTTRTRPCYENALRASTSITSSRASTSTSDQHSQSKIDETEGTQESCKPVLAPSPTGQISLKSITNGAIAQKGNAEQHKLMLYLDEDESNQPLPDFSEFGYLVMHSLQSEHSLPSLRSTSPASDKIPMDASSSPPKPNFETGRSHRGHRSPSTMASVPEDSELASEPQDSPRPDSPISPDAFPTVPQVRTTLSSIARLSAVGSTPAYDERGRAARR